MPNSPTETRFALARRACGLGALVVLVACVWCHGVLFVEGGSMRPALRPGDVVVFRRVGRVPAVGDMAVFEHGSTLVVHRVVGVARGGGLHTRGDANDAPDPGTVEPDRLRGCVVLVVPSGRLVEYLVARTP